MFRILVILLLLISFNTYGQEWDYSFTHYNKKDGLPGNTVYYVTSDKNGCIWVGTDAGVSKFDGNHFETITTSNGLSNNEVFEVYCDSYNRLWFITMGNEISYYYRNKIFNKQNDLKLSKIIIPDRLNRVLEDRNKNIWVVAFPFTINKIMPDGKVVNFDLSKKFGQCYKIYSSKNGIKFITANTTIEFNYSKNKFEELVGPISTEVNDIVFNKDGTYYYSDQNQHNSVLYTKSKTFQKYTSKIGIITLFKIKNLIWQITNKGLINYDSLLRQKELMMKDYAISNMCEDKFGNIWISTLNNGLYKLNSKLIKYFRPRLDGIASSMHSVYVDSNKIYSGNNVGDLSILSKDKNHKIIKSNLKANSILSYRILKILKYNSNLILATDVNTYEYVENSNHFINLDYAKSKAYKNAYIQNDTLILLTNVGFIYHSDKNKYTYEYILNDRFYSFCEYNGQRLFGSENALYIEHDGLTKYKLDQPFTHRIMDLKTFDSLLCVATTEKGVFFVKDHQVVRNLSLDQGLNSNTSTKMVPYKNVLFIATNNGICRYNYASRSTYKIMESDGLASNNVQDITINQDTLYAATDNGLSVIPIASLPDKYPFSFFISPATSTIDTCWELNGSIRSRTDLPITLTMNSISLGTKGPVKYYYRILERDSSFTTTLDPTITLKLDYPGTYTFESYSSDINNALSQKALMQIYIIPYWYQTFLFKLSCLLLFIGSIFFFTRFMIARSLKKEKLKRALADKIQQLELEAWKSNINPHFLFNSINTMQSLFSSNQFEKANEYIASFSRVLRKTIDNSEKLMITIEEEIGYLRNYLSLEKIKKGNNLIYVIDFDREVLPYYIPTLLIQPVIENSIKHGIQEKKHGVITVTLRLKDNQIVCTILDNGKGLPENFVPEMESKGLKMIVDKIRITERITGQSIHFELKNRRKHNKPGYGINCTLILPVYESLYYYPTADHAITDK